MNSLSKNRVVVLYVSRHVHNAASTKTVEPTQKPEKITDTIPKPFTYRLVRHDRRNPHILNEAFELPGHHDYSLYRLHDYYKTAELVKSFKTPAERIQFVSPFERGWSRTDKKWHRVNHPPLHAVRKAWAVDPIPAYFDSEDFIMRITRTRQALGVDGVPLTEEERKTIWKNCYKALNMPFSSFEKRVTESLICILDGKTDFDKEKANRFLTQFVDNGQSALTHTNLFVDQRVSLNPRCESFWVCAGFEDVYKKHDPMTGEIATNRHFIAKYVGDNRQKLGELAFTMRDELVAQIRQRSPLTGIDLETKDVDPKFSYDKKFEGPFTPWAHKLNHDKNHLWQCPGYEPDSGEIYPFGRVAVKNIFDLNDRIQYWDIPDEQELKDTRLNCLRSIATSSLFNWLNGQIHCMGYTQYTDDGNIDLTSQMVLSDGREFFFAAGNLRTIAFNINFDKILESNPDYAHLIPERRHNRVIFEGPYNLFDEYDPSTNSFKYKDEETDTMKAGLNPIVLQYFLNMLVTK